MLPILLAATAYEETCTFGQINQGGWIGINMIVILLAVLVGVAVYTIAILLPTATRERVRGAAKTEALQAVISLLIVIILLGFALTCCQAGEGLTSELTLGTYTDPMHFAILYMQNLLLFRTNQIFGQLYSQSALFMITGHIETQIIESIELVLPAGLLLDLSSDVTGVYFGYVGVLTGTYTALIVAAYAVLFIFYFLLQIIEVTALTVLLPITTVIRAWPFGGPRLREAANAFLGIAVAFYFILPLTITFNTYVINWMYCDNNYVGTGTPMQLMGQNCNPYVNYILFTQPATLQLNTLFSGSQSDVQLNGLGGGTLPLQFFGGTLSGAGGIGAVFSSTLAHLFELPSVIISYGYTIAELMFESIVLIALDIAITVGFAQGLGKGLNFVVPTTVNLQGNLISMPFWGNV